MTPLEFFWKFLGGAPNFFSYYNLVPLVLPPFIAQSVSPVAIGGLKGDMGGRVFFGSIFSFDIFDRT